ncbi:hypothetical protein CYMTET_6356 [Cymbomonas tetramitiformis]|uniref:Uncharacterized protein n=1 Tax=Cymbomonas tetramitiformis TaxID=36881 RepID=A0AAE0GXE8_9CHLO|nr:hypothetical protein CYMTET_6356 [Cymbomonas tetramitiformis]
MCSLSTARTIAINHLHQPDPAVVLRQPPLADSFYPDYGGTLTQIAQQAVAMRIEGGFLPPPAVDAAPNFMQAAASVAPRLGPPDPMVVLRQPPFDISHPDAGGTLTQFAQQAVAMRTEGGISPPPAVDAAPANSLQAAASVTTGLAQPDAVAVLCLPPLDISHP